MEEWTPQQIKEKLDSAIRRLWRFSPARLNFIERMKVRVFETKGSKRYRVVWYCDGCLKACYEKEKYIDHIEPVYPVDRYLRSYDELIERIGLNDNTNLQILCRNCHADKTRAENDLRNRFKDTHRRNQK